MPRFLMLVAPEARGTLSLSPGALAEKGQAMLRWVTAERRGGVLRDAFALGARADRLQLGAAGTALAQPTARATPLRACFVIEAADAAAACRIAATCPAAWPGEVEVIPAFTATGKERASLA